MRNRCSVRVPRLGLSTFVLVPAGRGTSRELVSPVRCCRTIGPCIVRLNIALRGNEQGEDDGGIQGGYATLVVGTAILRAHCAVLIACSGFFYSLFSRHTVGTRERSVSLSLPESLDADSVSLLLDFMYTSRLPLSARIVPGVLAAATYLQMEHVVDNCHAFMLHSERMSGAPQKELESPSSAASLAPPGGAFPNSHPTLRTPASFPAGGAAPYLCCNAARVPGESWVSKDPGTCLSHEPRSERVKLEVESPTLESPTPSPDSPSRSGCQPNSPAESSGCSQGPQPVTHNGTKSIPDPKACNWKKYKFIVLNPLCAATVKEEESAEGEGLRHCRHTTNGTDGLASTPKPPLEAWPVDRPGHNSRVGQGFHRDMSQHNVLQGGCHGLMPQPTDELPHLPTPLPQDSSAPCGSLCQHPSSSDPHATHHNDHLHHLGDNPNRRPIKSESCCSAFHASGTAGGAKPVSTGDKPEKPYRCDTCGARFVQVAHLRAHVLIHTGEKPYPCHTCGTRFRHLQTLKSHLRIHTGEKPYTCEKCDLHFRHKSQLRLHLRQKHGAITNTKIRYKVLIDPYRPVLQSC
ncbi:hypothetical protein AAFF_G00325030 [Aldrovandia affinis]|uniref:BCL6B transcription repressor n=1 Tax=Aldrovandia affinis TaxID=143900 RepID=A0AAD7X1A6_9TELE|nr:hypothetical protein AAFF_G00325030 [Aldrovandia affinis]